MSFHNGRAQERAGNKNELIRMIAMHRLARGMSMEEATADRKALMKLNKVSLKNREREEWKLYADR